MKRFSLFLASFILLYCTMPNSALAASVTAQFNAADNSVTLSGSGEGIVTIRVTGDGESEISKLKLPVVFHQIESEESYEYTFYMPDGSGAGKFNVFVADINGSDSDTFLGYILSDANDLIKKLENVSDKEFVSTVTDDENAKKLGIDKDGEDYSEESVVLMRKLYKTYVDATDFLNKYNLCNAINSLSGKENSVVEGKLQKYSKILNVDFKTEFKENADLSDKAKENVLSLLSATDYYKWSEDAEKLTGEKEFKAYFKAICALASINAVESWRDLERIYTNTYSFLNENIVEKNKDAEDVSQDDIYVELIKMKFDDIGDMETNFDNAVEKAKPKKSTKPSASSGGGGGGFSVSAGGSSTKPFETLPKENKENADTLSFSLPTLSGEGKAFSDVSSDMWFYPALAKLSGAGIISGNEKGLFMPQNSITRAEFTKIVVSAFSILSPEKKTFTDVADDAWYKDYVETASGAGIVNGSGSTFSPEKSITREDAVVILGRVAKLFSVEFEGYKEFGDMNDVSSYALTSVGAFYQNNVVKGKDDGNFCPKENITRAEAVQLIYNFTEKMAEKYGEVSK